LILTTPFNQSVLWKEYHCDILIQTMYSTYKIIYLIAVCKPEAANS